MVRPAPQSNGPHHMPLGRAALGALMVLAGSLTLFVLVWMSNSSAPSAQKLMFDLGLALTSLISAGAQACVFFGVWILWRAVRGRA